LLREGLDIPEVSLVAILDADKEGFLRSERSLIQTIGRAARNINGRAILYGDRITGSMERAIAESERRRAVQIAFNTEHNIQPVGVIKRVTDVMEGAYAGMTAVKSGGRNKVAERHKGEYQLVVNGMDAKGLAKEISRLEARMYESARNLDFEEAARTRDAIAGLKLQMLQS